MTRGGPHLVSYRGRIEVPGEYFRKRGWEVSVGPYVDADVHVFSKHFDKEGDLVGARKSPCPVFDVCDDHFSGVHGDYYREMVGLAREVITSSEGLAEIAGRGRVIYEPYELPEGRVRTPTEKKVLWYGHKSQLQTLNDYIEPLKKMGWLLKVVTNLPGEKFGPIEVIPFSLEAQREALRWCHVVLLPQPKFWKSPNRMVEAFRAGRLPILADIPAYRGWGLPVGNILSTLKQCLKHDWTPILRKNQERVGREFSPEKIGKDWYDCISAVVGSTGKGGSTATLMNPLML